MSDDSSSNINLDLINMVQNARMMHDADAQPSQISATYWVECKRKVGDYPAPTAHSGEWRIPTIVSVVDAQWEKIKNATESGKLGHKSKVSTKASKGQAKIDARVICVRTYNADDETDVQRIRAEIEQLNIQPFGGDIYYQRDQK